ncbi:hypothetical protein U0070_005873 [Myodes glareolus]|uniref:Group XIIA secretory phospholipase A2 n=1 Tax=Myodes glareolus TaxID=447135 RepID=A0AAW0IJN8_MYOGA
MTTFVFYIGSKPLPRYGFKPSPPNGCGSPLFGVHLNIGIPSLTKCCNQHDRCYETCGKSKSDCDEEFQYCLSKICRDRVKQRWSSCLTVSYIWAASHTWTASEPHVGAVMKKKQICKEAPEAGGQTTMKDKEHALTSLKPPYFWNGSL